MTYITTHDQYFNLTGSLVCYRILKGTTYVNLIQTVEKNVSVCSCLMVDLVYIKKKYPKVQSITIILERDFNRK